MVRKNGKVDVNTIKVEYKEDAVEFNDRNFGFSVDISSSLRKSLKNSLKTV